MVNLNGSLSTGSVEGETLTKIHLTTAGFKIVFQNNLGNLITFVWINHLMIKLKSDTWVIHCMMCKLYISLISYPPLKKCPAFWIDLRVVLGFSPNWNQTSAEAFSGVCLSIINEKIWISNSLLWQQNVWNGYKSWIEWDFFNKLHICIGSIWGHTKKKTHVN